MEKGNLLGHRMPSLNGAVVLTFPTVESVEEVQTLLPDLQEWRKTEEGTEVVYREIKSFSCWHMEELLTELFALCNISQIMHAIKALHGEVLIDLWFYHYDDIFPSLFIGGKNMEIIRLLHADISIDPY